MSWRRSVFLSFFLVLLALVAGNAADEQQPPGRRQPVSPPRTEAPATPRGEPAKVERTRVTRSGRSVHVDVYLIDLVAKADQNTKLLERSELTGTINDVLSKVRALEKQGVLNTVKRLQFTTLDGEQAQIKEGGSKPSVTGINFRGGFGGFGGGNARGGMPGGGGGPVEESRNIIYQTVGTTVNGKPEIGADGSVILDLKVQDSRIQIPEDGVVMATDSKGVPVRAMETVSLTVESKVKVQPGKVVLVEGTTTSSKTSQTQMLVLVSVSLE